MLVTPTRYQHTARTSSRSNAMLATRGSRPSSHVAHVAGSVGGAASAPVPRAWTSAVPPASATHHTPNATDRRSLASPSIALPFVSSSVAGVLGVASPPIGAYHTLSHHAVHLDSGGWGPGFGRTVQRTGQR